jgi:hypothetical protein
MIDFSTLESETVDQCLAISVAADATGDYEHLSMPTRGSRWFSYTT